jgi:LPS sulfotransferase NodH
LFDEKRAWERFFSAEGLMPAREMALDLRADIPPGVGYDKLADARNKDWIERVQRHVLQMP